MRRGLLGLTANVRRVARHPHAELAAGKARAGLERPRRRAAWIAAALALGGFPLAVTLARSHSYSSSISLRPLQAKPYPAPSVVETRRFLRDPGLRQDIAVALSQRALPNIFESIRVSQLAGRRELSLSATSSTAERAQAIVVTVAYKLADQSARSLRQVVRSELRALSLAPPRLLSRATLRYRAALQRLLPRPPARYSVGAHPRTQSSKRWGDQLIGRLPGPHPARPRPWAAALAGLMVVITLWGLSLWLAPPGRARRPRWGPEAN